MQVWQIAGIGSVALALLLMDGDHGSGVLATLRSKGHLSLGLLFEEHLDGVGRVHTAKLGVVTQHF